MSKKWHNTIQCVRNYLCVYSACLRACVSPASNVLAILSCGIRLHHNLDMYKLIKSSWSRRYVYVSDNYVCSLYERFDYAKNCHFFSVNWYFCLSNIMIRTNWGFCPKILHKYMYELFMCIFFSWNVLWVLYEIYYKGGIDLVYMYYTCMLSYTFII